MKGFKRGKEVSFTIDRKILLKHFLIFIQLLQKLPAKYFTKGTTYVVYVVETFSTLYPVFLRTLMGLCVNLQPQR